MSKTVGVDQDLTIADELVFILTTTDSDGCLITPYSIDQVTIYFASREFSSGNYSEYTKDVIDPQLLVELEVAIQAVCADPTDENIKEVDRIKYQIEQSKFSSKFYFKDAQVIKIFGGYVDEEGELFPAWLDPDQVPGDEVESVILSNLLTPYEEDNEVVTGKFVLNWNPLGQKEGDYFICWTWKPNSAGDSLSAHMQFTLGGNTQLTTALPTHFTTPGKYEMLLDRYLPEHCKAYISNQDLTPIVLTELNKAVAKGFTFVEDMANQVIDLLDANATHESLLSLLGNLFNLRFKSNDPTLWRKQIKKAIPNFKKKGTLDGLRSALSDAGMSLLKFTRLWQVISDYTWQELFDVSEDQVEFELNKTILLPVDDDNFELYYRAVDSDEWETLNSDYVTISGNVVTWIGDQLSVNPIILEEGDSIRIVYQIESVPSDPAQTLENYVRDLPLMDQRDERDQSYPPKNWNTRLIEEDDPLFDVLVPIKHPLADPLVWGQIRTEFPYSENVYNMEEYNGSIRDSLNPCDIAKDFIDPCSNCQSSSFNIDIEIEELSDDRILEAQDIIDEFVPAHAMIHSINFTGAIHEFIRPPIEEIGSLVSMRGEEITLAGEGQYIFNRAIPIEDALAIAKRDMLANMTARTGLVTGTASNPSIVLVSPGTSTKSELSNPNFYGTFVGFKSYGINTDDVSGAALDNSNWLEILSPHVNYGNYSVSDIQKNMVTIAAGTVIEPLNKGTFTFRLSNRIYNQTPVDIIQDNVYKFSNNDDVDFTVLGIINQHDIDNDLATGSPWQLSIDGYGSYDILNVLPDNTLLLLNDGSLPSSSTGLTWEILDSDSDTVADGEDGDLDVIDRAIVDFNPGSYGCPIDDIFNIFKINDYIYYDGNQYKVIGFVPGTPYELYIEDYNDGDAVGIEVTVYRRLLDNMVGNFEYLGLQLETLTDYEAALPVQNGVNAVATPTEASEYKENYLILITNDSTPDTSDPSLNYYIIEEIDGTTITLGGPVADWSTSGTSVQFIIYQFVKQPINIPERSDPYVPGHNFNYENDPPLGLGGHVDPSGSEVISLEIENSTPYYAHVLNTANSGSQISEVVEQVESISYVIEYLDGTVEEAKI